MRHMASQLEIFYAIIKMKYFTVNGDLTELPQNDTQTLIIEKTFLSSEIPIAEHINI